MFNSNTVELTLSEKARVLRLTALAQRAMNKRKYSLSHRLLDALPESLPHAAKATAAKMKLLVIEHEALHSRDAV